jgi:hypothetical protein
MCAWPSRVPVKTDRSYRISQIDKIQAQPNHGCAWHRPRWSVRKSYGTSATRWLTSGLRATQIKRKWPWHTSCCTAKSRHPETRCGITCSSGSTFNPVDRTERWLDPLAGYMRDTGSSYHFSLSHYYNTTHCLWPLHHLDKVFVCNSHVTN